MEVRADALAARLQRGLPRAAWVCGDEPLLLIEAADALRAKARSEGFTERSVIAVDRGFGAAALAEQGGTRSLFAERRIVEIRFAAAARPSREATRVIAEFAAAAGDDLFVLVSSARPDRALRESAPFVAFDKFGWVVPVYAISREELPRWLAGRLAAQDQRASPEALAAMAERVEGNLLAASQEVQKLGLMLPTGPIDDTAMREATINVARYDPAHLVEAMLGGNHARALRALDGLRAEGEPLPRIVWVLAEAIRILLKLHAMTAAGMAPAQALRAIRIWPQTRERLFAEALAQTRPTDVADALLRMAAIDRIAKGVGRHEGSGDAWQELIAVITTLRRPVPPAPQGPARGSGTKAGANPADAVRAALTRRPA